MGGAPAVLKGFAGVHIYVGCACTDHLLERALTRWVQTQHARASSPTAHTPPPSHPTPTVAYMPPPSRTPPTVAHTLPPSRTRPHRRVYTPTVAYTPPPLRTRPHRHIPQVHRPGAHPRVPAHH